MAGQPLLDSLAPGTYYSGLQAFVTIQATMQGLFRTLEAPYTRAHSAWVPAMQAT